MNLFRLVGFLSISCCFAADPDGAALYKQRCAICHEVSGETRAPRPSAMRLMSPENIVRSLETGMMKEQGAPLNAKEKQTVAEFLTGKAIGEAAKPVVGMCADPKAPFSPSGAAWNGWGSDLANTRFQSTEQAGLTAAQVPRLKLKWAFAFPSTFIANGQPTIVGGRVFVPSANRNIYSLDAKTGCQYWSFEAQAPARTAISIATLKGERTRHVAFFGDRRGNAYAVDASSGELLWKTHVDEHSHATIVGAPQYYDGRLYVPVTAAEEGSAMNPKYECCSARGAMVALDAFTGKLIWKTYTIAEEPHPLSKNSEGAQMWGPSGASIWSAPTLDIEKKAIYAGTGDNFSGAPTKTSDAIIAFDMETGKILWVRQLTEGDVFNMGCVQGVSKASCPDPAGPDVDIGASPILVKLPNGKRVLLVSQKSGVAHGLDPDRNGEILWQTRIGHGGALGGIQWGSASDGKNMYAALSDIKFLKEEFGAGKKLVADPKSGGGLFALDAATGKKVWTAAPPDCGERPSCSPAQSAAISAIPGVVFSGSVVGRLRGYSTADGKVIWEFDTAREFTTVNGLTAKGGSMDGPGPTIVGGMLFADSGYGNWGGLPGNVLMAFSVDGK
ncbi:MAG TPA: PQQ-binding-like beta-propeller repeat protein [Bryobacteraceae bacterium]|nr:PQQ-binding-like beta-propeller repeat protein [Bryobacteraceae bacterium]